MRVTGGKPKTFRQCDIKIPKMCHIMQATEAADRLYDNLRQEQTLLIQSLCASHQQILAPEQAGSFSPVPHLLQKQ